METVEKKTNGKDVLDCVLEQQRLFRTVTRELVADVMKIPQYVADFHLKKTCG
jgi:transposase